jgi:glycerol-3-phosphate dehydrogenase
MSMRSAEDAMPADQNQPFDLLIIGGGINGAGIARDAAGRGLRVLLVEQEDLAQHTSSASTKLIHGGLRYLEYYEFRLVREALMERERLLAMAPHIIWPLRFVLPHENAVRPAWMVRLGLFLYDHLGGRKRLPASESVSFPDGRFGSALRPGIGKGFVYSDCWVEDSRLVVLNAMDAAERGAAIHTRTRFLDAQRNGALWQATVQDLGSGERKAVAARAIVNAAGPWVGQVLDQGLGIPGEATVRLVKGSHLVVPKLYEGGHAYILQNPDRRIVFAIPYEQDFTLIGTTDVAWKQAPGKVTISPEEAAYLCESVNRYFSRQIRPEDAVWSYAGVRPLYDNAARSDSAVTRDYVLNVDAPVGGAPLLSVFGGKITTYRRLAEHALEKLQPHLGLPATSWTAGAPLPGGDMPDADFDRFLAGLRQRAPFLPEALARRLARAYGSRVDALLGDARAMADLGEDFGGGLTRAEVDYLLRKEWAVTAEDILWRRSKLGLHVPAGTEARLRDYLAMARPGKLASAAD